MLCERCGLREEFEFVAVGTSLGLPALGLCQLCADTQKEMLHNATAGRQGHVVHPDFEAARRDIIQLTSSASESELTEAARVMVEWSKASGRALPDDLAAFVDRHLGE
jgi:hypothetical protein